MRTHDIQPHLKIRVVIARNVSCESAWSGYGWSEPRCIPAWCRRLSSALSFLGECSLWLTLDYDISNNDPATTPFVTPWQTYSENGRVARRTKSSERRLGSGQSGVGNLTYLGGHWTTSSSFQCA